MKRNILTSAVLLLGSSIAVMAVCFIDTETDCPANVSVSGETGCSLNDQYHKQYPSVVEGSPGWTSAYADKIKYCQYLCKSGDVFYFYVGDFTTGNTCKGGGSGS